MVPHHSSAFWKHYTNAKEEMPFLKSKRNYFLKTGCKCISLDAVEQYSVFYFCQVGFLTVFLLSEFSTLKAWSSGLSFSQELAKRANKKKGESGAAI